MLLYQRSDVIVGKISLGLRAFLPLGYLPLVSHMHHTIVPRFKRPELRLAGVLRLGSMRSVALASQERHCLWTLLILLTCPEVLERMVGFEPTTFDLEGHCSSQTELHPHYT